MAEGNIKRLIPVGFKPITSFTNKNNQPTTLYKVEATDENGGVIAEELRSFQEFPIGEAQEFRIERYEHQTHGISYTLYPVKKQQGGVRLGPRVDELRERVTALEEMVRSLVSRVEELESGADRSPPPRRDPNPTSTTHREDEDIPF